MHNVRYIVLLIPNQTRIMLWLCYVGELQVESRMANILTVDNGKVQIFSDKFMKYNTGLLYMLQFFWVEFLTEAHRHIHNI